MPAFDEEEEEMDDVMIWAIPFGFFVCVSAVQAIRRHWKNALSALLAAGITLAIMANAGQVHTNAILRARLHYYEGKATELQRQLEKQNGTSNQVSDATSEPAPDAVSSSHQD